MDRQEMIYHDEVGLILDCAVEVHRIPGHGLPEMPYENTLVSSSISNPHISKPAA